MTIDDRSVARRWSLSGVRCKRAPQKIRQLEWERQSPSLRIARNDNRQGAWRKIHKQVQSKPSNGLQRTSLDSGGMMKINNAGFNILRKRRALGHSSTLTVSQRKARYGGLERATLCTNTRSPTMQSPPVSRTSMRFKASQRPARPGTQTPSRPSSPLQKTMPSIRTSRIPSILRRPFSTT